MRLALLAALFLAAAAPAQRAAISADPASDRAKPAGMEVLRIPTGGVAVNGIAYLPSGAGPHPILLILHGWPGNEKNLDLAQAARRDGWVAVTFNYRGSWGSPGRFAFAHVLEDTAAALAHLRDPAIAARLRADPKRIVVAGHSMGGWAALHTAASDRRLLGVAAISAADMGAMATQPRTQMLKRATDNSAPLATTPQAMVEELVARGPQWRLDRAVPGLARTPVLVLSSDDGFAPGTDALVAALRGAGNTHVDAHHEATDHGWSDRRIALQERVLDWAAKLR